MYVSALCALLMILHFISRLSSGSVIHSKPYSRMEKTNVGTIVMSKNANNITVACENYTREAVFQCHRDLYYLAYYGYPWSPRSSQRQHNHNDPTDRNNTLMDSLDSLNYVCAIYDKSQTCLEENGISDYCLATTANRTSKRIFILSVTTNAAMPI